MIRRAGAAVVLACVGMIAGCNNKPPDYQSLWTTSTPTTTTTEDPVPIGQYLDGEGVTAKPVAPDSLTGLTVSMPTPPGWSRRQSPKLESNNRVIVKGDNLATAILTVLELDGDFDAAEAVKHGTLDAELSENFVRLDASFADFHGFPSAMIQGSHDAEGMRVHSWFRMVIATGSPPANQRYLVQLLILTQSDKAAAQASDVEQIINGFTVAAK